MNAGTVLNIIGTICMLGGIVMHAICVAAPNYVHGDMTNLRVDVKGKHFSDEVLEVIYELADSKMKIHYGLFEFCNSTSIQPQEECRPWDNDFTVGAWLQAAKVMGILGLIVMCMAALAALIHIWGRCRGDRFWLLPMPNIICAVAVVGGVCSFISDVVIISSYQTCPPLGGYDEDLPDAAIKVLGKEFKLTSGLHFDVVASVMVCLGGAIHQLAMRYEEKYRLYSATI